jgi:hypothetical protein
LTATAERRRRFHFVQSAVFTGADFLLGAIAGYALDSLADGTDADTALSGTLRAITGYGAID